MTIMSKSKRQDGWWYPWLFVGAFGIIIAVNGTMAYLALDTWTGLETKNYYQKGQEFNEALAQKAAQAKLGWTAKARFDALPSADQPRTGLIHLNFANAQGLGVGALEIEASAVRPTSEGHDQPLTFTAQGDGHYVAPVTFALPGQWELRATASRADEVFKLRYRLQVP